MNTWQSIWLIRELYFKKGAPDIEHIQKLGLLAVKIGQIHALRLDFLPAEKCQKLSELYRRNIPIAQEDIDKLIDLQSPPNFREHFKNISLRPLATASVGQVYQAELKEGDLAVIKVIKADFKKRFASDVKKLRKFFKLVLGFYPKLKQVGDPMGILEDIESYTLAELDLRNEMLGAKRLQNIHERYKLTFDLSFLRFPKYYPDLCGENILTSQFIPAPSVDELLEQKKFSYPDLIKLFYIQGFYIFIAGEFHGDIHPGNVLYDGKNFYFVDTAYIGEVSDRIRKGLFWFFEALSRYDYPECAKWLNAMSQTSIAGERFEEFKKNFMELYKDYTKSTVSQVSLTRQMMLTIKLGVNAGMRFEKGIFPIIRSLMYLDGMVLKCNPNAILVEDMRQFIEDYKRYV